MIENFHQYQVTSEAVRKFELALDELDHAPRLDKTNPLIRKAQRDGIVSVLMELVADMTEFEHREINARMQRQEQGIGVAFLRKFKNTAAHGRKMAFSPFSMCVTKHGICLNGDYGTNPSREEMREMLDAMRELVADWDERYGDKSDAN